jgi:hypothetical protein
MLNTTLQLKSSWARALFKIELNWGFLLGFVCLALALTQNGRAAEIYEAEGKTYIIDQRGERWEITQATTLGFRPEGFQFGIGRDAIRPLKSEDLKTDADSMPEATRVIGIADEDNGNAHAYSVGRMVRHEIANTLLGETPIATAY